jgi:hypothetical protein
MRAGQGAAEDGEILGEDIDQTAADGAAARDHAVAGDALVLHAELGRAVLDEHVGFLERALVQQNVDAFAGGQLALAVLAGDAFLAAAEAGAGAALFQLFEDGLHAGSP